MGFNERLHDYRLKQEESNLIQKTRKENQRLTERQRIWDTSIIPGFNVMEELGIKGILDEIKDAVWKGGEVVTSPENIEDIEFIPDSDGDEKNIATISNTMAQYRLNNPQSGFISIKSGGTTVIFETDRSYKTIIPARDKKGKLDKDCKIKIEEALYRDFLKREN